MIKRFFAVLTLVVMLATVVCAALADETVPFCAPMGGWNVNASISKSGNTIQASGALTNDQGYKSDITVKVQRQNGNDWVTVRTKTFKGAREGSIEYTTNTSGVYRTYVSCAIKDDSGSTIQTIKVKSKSRSY